MAIWCMKKNLLACIYQVIISFLIFFNAQCIICDTFSLLTMITFVNSLDPDQA